MRLHRVEDVRWEPAGEEHFTGQVRMAALATPPDEDGLLVLGVEFAPGARTDWHSHPGGQVLYVVDGVCRLGNEAGELVELTPGDVAQIPAGEVHWHGASPHGSMTHLSLTSHGVTRWEPRKVTDDEYGGR